MPPAPVTISWERTRACKKSGRLGIERCQERGDLDRATQKLTPEMPGNSRFPFLSLEPQVTIIKAAIRNRPVD
jgi:hypothetical protein